MTDLNRQRNARDRRREQSLKSGKIPPDTSQFVIDLSKSRITCQYCGAWTRFDLNNGFSEIEQKQIFKNSHLKCK